MFKSIFNQIKLNKEEKEKELNNLSEKLNNLSEKELLIEIILELKKLNEHCDKIEDLIVLWNN